MKKTKLFLFALISLCFCITGVKAEGVTAKIGDNEYNTLDAAIEEAKDGDVIELINDGTVTKAFNKSLTFKGKYTITFDGMLDNTGEAQWSYKGNMTFDGTNFIWDATDWNNTNGRWVMLVLTGRLKLDNGAIGTFKFDSLNGVKCAIYSNGGASIEIDNASTLNILGTNTKGINGHAIQLDSTAGTGIFVKNDSTLFIDGTNRGYVNSPEIYVENSKFIVQNCTSNASNGGVFTAINSEIKFLNNNGHGLSAATFTAVNSNITTNGNAFYGITVIFIICAYIILAVSSLKSAYNVELRMKQGKHINTFVEDIKALFNENLHKLLLVLPVTGILVFTILPLVFMISMAFTSYSKVDSHLVLFDWVGLENFKLIFNSGSSIGQSFWSVFGWTIIWAVLATFLNYILGILVALLINRKGTKFKSFWRFIFILSIAIPQFVSLLIIRSMLAQDGIINVVLKNAGWISKSLPFFTNATWARMTVIIVNLWQVTGILQNIPMELYEAADVDGANGFVKFFKITMPYMLFVTTPYLITTFTANVNNFNIVYLLTKGDPVLAGHTAGKTDLLVTWLYKMTVDYQYYNLGAVIGIMTFVFLALGSLLVYRRTKSYKDEEGFQ